MKQEITEFLIVAKVNGKWRRINLSEEQDELFDQILDLFEGKICVDLKPII